MTAEELARSVDSLCECGHTWGDHSVNGHHHCLANRESMLDKGACEENCLAFMPAVAEEEPPKTTWCEPCWSYHRRPCAKGSGRA